MLKRFVVGNNDEMSTLQILLELLIIKNSGESFFSAGISDLLAKAIVFYFHPPICVRSQLLLRMEKQGVQGASMEHNVPVL